MIKFNQLFIKVFLNKYYDYIFPPTFLDPNIGSGKIYVFDNYQQLKAFLSQYIDDVDEEVCNHVIAGKTTHSGKIIVYQHVCHKFIIKCQDNKEMTLRKRVNNHK